MCRDVTISGHKEGGHDLTPEKVMHETLKESQRLKIADLEDRRSEDSEKRKDDERFVDVQNSKCFTDSETYQLLTITCTV